MKIPLVGEPEVSVPGQTFARVDPDIYARVGEAGQRLGQAVEGLGDVAVRIKSVYDDAAITKLTTQFDAGSRDAINSLTTAIDPATGKIDERNNDPMTYGQRWQEMKARLIDSVQNDPMAKSLGREGQLHLKIAMGSIMINSDKDVDVMTRQKMIDVAKANNSTAIEGLIMAGKENEALAKNDYMTATHQQSPEEGAANKIQIPRRIDESNAQHLMSVPVELGGGPYVAEKKLIEQDKDGKFVNFTRLLPEKRTELLKQAEYYGRDLTYHKREEFANMTANNIPIDPQIVKNYVKWEVLTKADEKALLKPVNTGDNAEAFSDVMSRISKIDGSKKLESVDWHERYDLNKAINNFTGENKTQAEQFLKEKINPNSPLNSLSFKQAIEGIEKTYEKGGYGDFKYKKPILTEKGKPTGEYTEVTNLAGLAKANNRRAELLTAAQHFVQQYAQDHDNASPSPQEINDYLNSFQKIDGATSFWRKPINPLSGKAAP